jgi:peptidoglycan/LPS O-acetylase OafA/YrhL
MQISKKTLNHLEYRPDIDGLRAVAILAVISFHAFPNWLKGGFVGVDIFFVISGYLISSIILKNLECDRFSYIEFYVRRIKRIFPALILVLVATFLLGWYVLLFDEYKQLGEHIAASASFSSNFILWNESGYFDTASNTKPLLHLWSLAIEEQFYLIWPLVLGIAWKKKLNLLVTILFFAVVSFSFSILLVSNNPVAAFYSPLSRFWELILGGLLACQTLGASRNPSIHRTWKSFTGFTLIAIGILFIDDNHFFPGIKALIPTFGAYFMISAGPDGWVNKKILSNKVLVWIGLISYPLYLWHWPLLSLARIINDNAMPSKVVRISIIAISFSLAWLTFILIENKFRASTSKSSPIVLSILMIANSLIGFLISNEKLVSRHSNPIINNVVRASMDWDYPDGLDAIKINGLKLFLKKTGVEKVLFVGDSHIQQYSPRVIALAKTGNTKSTYFASAGGCPPIPNIVIDTNITCAAFVKAIIHYASISDIDSVVLGAAWNHYFISSLHSINRNYYFSIGDKKINFKQEGKKLALVALESMLKQLVITKKVYFLLDNPSAEAFSPKTYIRGNRLSRDSISVREFSTYTPFDNDQALLRNELIEIANRAGAIILDPFPTLCPKNNCRILTDEGFFIYRDTNHLRPFYIRNHASYIDIAIK